MRRIFLAIIASLCIGMINLAYANVTSNKNTTSSQEAVECPMNDLVKFEFTDANKTTFSIPRPYLYRPYPTYNLEKEENYIVLYVWKETLKPDCNEIHYSDSNHYMIEIEPKSPEGFQRIMKMRTDKYNEFIAQEGQFKLYRKLEDLGKTNLVSVYDFLVPPKVDGLSSFLECYRPNLIGDIAPRAGCSVDSEISETIYIKYGVTPEKLGQWHEINSNIINLINNFKIQPKKD